MKSSDAMNQRGGKSQRLRLRTGLRTSALGRASCNAGVACALLASTSWAQEPESDSAEVSIDAELAAVEADSEVATEPIANSGEAPAAAQDGGPAEPELAQEPQADDDQVLDEIVVTADRRKKDLQDYAGTAAAFSASKLAAVGITKVTDLSQMVPGLQIGVNNGGATVYVRGIGSDNTTELGDPSVAQHLDGVYLPRFRGLSAGFLDVQRIEVNSGPQGTLRGRNATGGSINIISNQPVLNEYQANAEATFGSFNQRTFQGMINIPLGDTAAMRVAAGSSNIDAIWPNLGAIDTLPGAQTTNSYALKGALRWEPTSKLDITVAGDYSLERGTGWGVSNVIGLLTNRDDAGTELNQLDDVFAPIDVNNLDNPRAYYPKGRPPRDRLEHWGARLSANYDAGPVQVELLASHRYLDWQYASMAADGPFAESEDLLDQQLEDFSYSEQRRTDSSSSVVELRFASPDEQDLVWSFGLFGFYEQQGAALGQVQGDLNGGFNEFNMPSTRSNSVAAYADATLKITEKFRLLAGGRVTREHKDRLGGLWMIGANFPSGSSEICARADAQGECAEIGLRNDGIGRFGTEGFRHALLDRTNYDVPGFDGNPNSKEDRVNYFLNGIDSFGAQDQTALALCKALPGEVLTDGRGVTSIQTQDRLVEIDGQLQCANGVRDEVPDDFLLIRPQNGRRNDMYADFRVGFEYDLAKDNMLYGTLSSAHKTGGFNDSLPDPDQRLDDGTQDPDAYLTPGYGPEVAYSLEIGSKNLLMDRKLRLNASAFVFAYGGLQFQTILTVGTAPPLNPDGTVATNLDTGEPYQDNRGGTAARQNADNASMVYGLDIDGAYALPFGMEVGAHALLMDARFPDDTYVNDGRLGLGNSAQVDIGGNMLPRVSPFTLNYNLSQMIFNELGQFDWIVQGQTRGAHFMSAFNGNGERFATRGPDWGRDPVTGLELAEPPQDTPGYSVIEENLERLDDQVLAYTVINLGVGWRHPDGRLSVRGFLNNAFNTTYANSITSNANNTRSYNNPRTAGVRVRMDW